MRRLLTVACATAVIGVAHAQTPAAPPAAPDPELARTLGADAYGMRHYVLVVLKSGPTPLPAGSERDAMFGAHLANIRRLAAEGRLAVAGPFERTDDGWRGLFVFATADVDEAKRWVATDPVVARGEMVAEYHALYCSAALMTVATTHERIAAKSF